MSVCKTETQDEVRPNTEENNIRKRKYIYS